MASSLDELPEDGNEVVIARENSSTGMSDSKFESLLILLHTLLPASQNVTQPERRESLGMSVLPLPLMGKHCGRFCS